LVVSLSLLDQYRLDTKLRSGLLPGKSTDAISLLDLSWGVEGVEVQRVRGPIREVEARAEQRIVGHAEVEVVVVIINELQMAADAQRAAALFTYS
jgi:hypothetical protein